MLKQFSEKRQQSKRVLIRCWLLGHWCKLFVYLVCCLVVHAGFSFPPRRNSTVRNSRERWDRLAICYLHRESCHSLLRSLASGNGTPSRNWIVSGRWKRARARLRPEAQEIERCCEWTTLSWVKFKRRSLEWFRGQRFFDWMKKEEYFRLIFCCWFFVGCR